MSVSLHAQTASDGRGEAATAFQFGVYGGGVLAPGSTQLSTFPNVACCSDSVLYSGRSDFDVAIEGIFGFHSLPSEGSSGELGARLKIGYATSTAVFEKDMKLGPVPDENGEAADAVSRSSVTTTMKRLWAEPMFDYWLGGSLPVIMSFGVRGSYLIYGRYEHVERLATPDWLVFTAENSRERNRVSGDISDFNRLQLGIAAGVGCDIPIAQGFGVHPEIGGMLALTRPVKNVDWRPHELRFGVALLYTLQ